MDTRILTLLVIISVAGSLAEARVPFYRVRRSGSQESDITAGREFVETPRAKRQSVFESSGTAESTAAPKPKDSTTVSAPSTDPANASPKKPNPTTKSNPTNPTRPTPGGSSTTSAANPTPGGSSTTSAANPTPSKADPTTSAPESTEPTDSETSDEQKSTTPKVGLGSRIDSEEPAQAKKPQTKPAASGSPLPPNGQFQPPQFIFPSSYGTYGDPYFNSIPGPNNYAWTGTHNGQGAAASLASAGASSSGSFAGGLGAGSGYGSKRPSLANRGGSSAGGFAGGPSTGSYAGSPSTGSYAGSPSTGSFAGGSSAGSFAGGFGAGSGYGTKHPSFVDRGAFVDNTPDVANFNSGYVPNFGYVPNAGYMPNMGNAGGFGYSGGGNSFPDPSSFAFPGFSPDNFQRQMDDYFRQWQNQFQKQQQQIFETANRIGTGGYSGQPGGHSAVSSISLGPQGGYQAGAINPAAPGVQSRFAEEIAPPSGGSFGVFSSSSSKTVVGPDGKPISHKISTTGVNDNGKITFRTVED